MNRKELALYVGELISGDRQESHGDVNEVFTCAQDLKATFQNWKGNTLGPIAEESLDLICTKIARIVCGRNLKDHWIDIAGYALLAAEVAEESA